MKRAERRPRSSQTKITNSPLSSSTGLLSPSSSGTLPFSRSNTISHLHSSLLRHITRPLYLVESDLINYPSRRGQLPPPEILPGHQPTRRSLQNLLGRLYSPPKPAFGLPVRNQGFLTCHRASAGHMAQPLPLVVGRLSRHSREGVALLTR